MLNNSPKIADLTPESRKKLIQFIRESIPSKVCYDENLMGEEALDQSIPYCGVGTYAPSFLHYAIITNDYDLLVDLCDKKADVNLRVQFPTYNENNSWVADSPLQCACSYGRFEMVKKLIEYGASLDGIKLLHQQNAVDRTITFFWSMKQRLFHGQRNDFEAVRQVVESTNQNRTHITPRP